MKFKLVLAPVLLLLGCAYPPPAASRVAIFRTEQAAQHHCPRDTVVWVDNISGIYHLKGEAWYGRVFDSGGYVCKREADKSPRMRHGYGIND